MNLNGGNANTVRIMNDVVAKVKWSDELFFVIFLYHQPAQAWAEIFLQKREAISFEFSLLA
jgi:hypothetical protein